MEEVIGSVGCDCIGAQSCQERVEESREGGMESKHVRALEGRSRRDVEGHISTF